MLEKQDILKKNTTTYTLKKSLNLLSLLHINNKKIHVRKVFYWLEKCINSYFMVEMIELEIKWHSCT